ncbi:hypothetical protein PC128_g6507 [Phytophthora cactorum]|nr:hypothetical protein PC128_g6507 [Phytophthora cactorum]
MKEQEEEEGSVAPSSCLVSDSKEVEGARTDKVSEPKRTPGREVKKTGSVHGVLAKQKVMETVDIGFEKNGTACPTERIGLGEAEDEDYAEMPDLDDFAPDGTTNCSNAYVTAVTIAPASSFNSEARGKTGTPGKA